MSLGREQKHLVRMGNSLDRVAARCVRFREAGLQKPGNAVVLCEE